MANHGERQRLKNIKTLEKLLGDGFIVSSYKGGFQIYKKGTASLTYPTGIRAYFKPVCGKWHLTSQQLGLDKPDIHLKEGAKFINMASLLVV